MSEPSAEFFAAVEVKIKETTYFFAPPPKGFDPRDPDVATDSVLRGYGLPPRPNPETHPARAAFWEKMFTRPNSKDCVDFVYARDHFEYDKLPPELPFLRPKRTLPRESTRGLHEASLNWSGAYVTPRNGRMFTEVHGTWSVPGAALPAGVNLTTNREGELEKPPLREFRSSTWIGLDGQRRYFNASLPQIGSSQYVSVAGFGTVIRREPVIWWEWWLKDAPNPLPIVLPLEAKAGDIVMASLFVVDATHVKFLVANHSTGVVCTPFVVREPTCYLEPHGPPGPVRVSGATAEWIMERPTNWETKEVFDLPDYDAVNFEDCHVVSGIAPGVDEHEEQPLGARLLTMFDIRDNPYRSTQVSIARRTGRNRFRTTNVRPVGPPGRGRV